ncbi:MAG: extracellular solute-binding protein [Chloroflexi bacterium]|nr:extracellular solute-binding protein [Chloroflexota bacterium]
MENETSSMIGQSEPLTKATTSRLMAILCLVWLLAAVGLAGCNFLAKLPLPSPEETPTATTVPGEATPSVSPTPSRPPAVSSAIALTIWTTEEFSPEDDDSGQVLAQQWQAFEAARANVTIEYVLKKPYGKGSILDFLSTSSAAAPTVLPDLVILDTLELDEAAMAGLIQPLDDLVSNELQQDLFPFARHSFDGQLMGIQFEADVEHLIYNTNKIDSPPLTWREVISDQIAYIFPAGGEGGLVNDAFLIQYLSAGGQLLDEEGKPALDEGTLVEVLQFYADGLEAGAIPPVVLDFEDLNDCWVVYVSAQAAMSNISSARYLADRGVLKNTSFAAIPTRDGNAGTLSKGWALAVVTTDLARQAIAAQFIEWLLEAENNADWNLAAGHLPTRQAAFDLLGTADPYFTFARQQLENVHPRPMTSAYEKIGRALQKAVQDVLTGEVSPEEAAETVMAVVEQ